MSASCSGKRKMRGRGFPGCAFAVTVPISTNPKPSAAHAGRATPFLSNPAASPTGFGNLMPNTVVGFGVRLKLSAAAGEFAPARRDTQREMMRRLRIEREKQWPNESFVGAAALHLPMQNWLKTEASIVLCIDCPNHFADRVDRGVEIDREIFRRCSFRGSSRALARALPARAADNRDAAC